jgi:hypothetical protein
MSVLFRRLFFAAAILSLAATARADEKPQSAPLLGPKPLFSPGMYESESRNSHFQGAPVKSKARIASTDYDHFLGDAMAQYRAAPQFAKAVHSARPDNSQTALRWRWRVPA